MSKKIKQIEDVLRVALLENGSMSKDLYHFELEDGVGFWRESMQKDNDDYLLVVTENKRNVAMLLFDKAGEIYINEQAREKLHTYWVPEAYQENMRKFIPSFASELSKEIIPHFGFKIVTRSFRA